MKTLNFTFRGKKYQVDENKRIKANGLDYFSDNWLFLGGSSHHWHNHITVTTEEAFKNPKLLTNCIGWDKDHGTLRTWGGAYNGKLPRIRDPYVTRK